MSDIELQISTLAARISEIVPTSEAAQLSIDVFAFLQSITQSKYDREYAIRLLLDQATFPTDHPSLLHLQAQLMNELLALAANQGERAFLCLKIALFAEANPRLSGFDTRVYAEFAQQHARNNGQVDLAVQARKLISKLG